MLTGSGNLRQHLLDLRVGFFGHSNSLREFQAISLFTHIDVGVVG